MGTIRLGTDLESRVIHQLDARTFRLASFDVYPGWDILLRSRHPRDRFLQPGDKVHAWIFSIHPRDRLMFVSVDEFGRLPVSDRMRPRYLRAMRAMLSLCESGATAPAHIPLQLVSEAKGILGRCLRKDQWDWYSMYRVLNHPVVDELRRARRILTALRDAAKQRDPAQVVSAIAAFAQTSIPSRFARGIGVLIAEAPRLEAATRLQGIALAKQVADEHEPPDRDPYLISAAALKKQEEASQTHELVIRLLAQELKRRGYIPEKNALIDVFARLEHAPAIFEVKSITSFNWRSQVRKGVSQLYEYRYLHGLGDAGLFLVLSRCPPEGWIIEYLQSDRHINVLWVSGEGFDGPGARLALGNRFDS